MDYRSKCGNFYRPLLDLNKETLLRYMIERDLAWSEDSSNQERKYKRNKIRLDLIPLMSEICGSESALKK